MLHLRCVMLVLALSMGSMLADEAAAQCPNCARSYSVVTAAPWTGPHYTAWKYSDARQRYECDHYYAPGMKHAVVYYPQDDARKGHYYFHNPGHRQYAYRIASPQHEQFAQQPKVIDRTAPDGQNWVPLDTQATSIAAMSGSIPQLAPPEPKL